MMRRLSAVALALAAVGCQAFLPGVPLAAPARSCSRLYAETTDVPMDLIKQLRGMSGAPIMDCKKALAAEGLDVEKAFDWLRKKGQASMAKRDRATKEGLVALAIEGSSAVIVEVNSETDFVARNADFQAFVQAAAATAVKLPGTGLLANEDLLKSNGPNGITIETELANLVAKIRENMTLRRASRVSVDNGVIASYVHNAAAPGMGQSAAVVAIKTDATGEARDKVEAMAKRLAMHVVAAGPQYLSPATVPADVVEREKEVIREQSKASGKPADVIEKMLEGRLRKYFAEITLLEQNHMVEEGNPKISDLLAKVGEEVGAKVELVDFIRYKTGDA